MSWWRHVLRRVARKIWFRAALYSVGAIVLALAARVLAPIMPDIFSSNIGQDSVGQILQILASSMLAVTTFSLTAMVQAYSSATTQGTPRATQLMLADNTSQNALSTFLGGFLFSIVGIVALSTGYYDPKARTILFIGTVFVIAMIVITLLRWISHVTGFGRMNDVIDRVEDAATEAMRAQAAEPWFGGMPPRQWEPDAIPVRPLVTGYVTLIDTAKLARIADGYDLYIHVQSLPGAMVHPGRPLLWVEGTVDGAVRDSLISAFTVEQHRNFDQDPRLGLIALSEIASRALSPAVNDPGTAIAVLNATQRVFLTLFDPDETDRAEPNPRLFVPELSVAELVEDAYRPIARDGADNIEVQIRLQKTLAALAEIAPDPKIFLDMADEAAERAREAMGHDADREALTIARQGIGLEEMPT